MKEINASVEVLYSVKKVLMIPKQFFQSTI